jgi:hypothetical protein
MMGFHFIDTSPEQGKLLGDWLSLLHPRPSVEPQMKPKNALPYEHQEYGSIRDV